MDAKAARALLDWYDAAGVALPWRERGQAPDPYRVWLSEVMLQQTTVAAVRPYFARFVERWPTVAALAAARDEDVMNAWAGLGYYARARNLLACARAVVARHGGAFPATEAGLRTLPGVGEYTAAAIAAIAFGERALVVDGNVDRVASRLLALPRPPAAERPAVRALLDRLTPADRPGDFAQALMDLGRTICRPRAPTCGSCPLRPECRAAELGTPELYPAKPPKAVRPERTGHAYALVSGGALMLVERPPSGLLGGMRGLPETPPVDAEWSEVGRVRHIFTHFQLTLTVHRATVAPRPPGLWWPVDRLDEAGLPTLFRRAADCATHDLAGLFAAA